MIFFSVRVSDLLQYKKLMATFLVLIFILNKEKSK